MGNVVKRVGAFDSATTRDMKLLQMNTNVLQDGGAQLKADLLELGDKIKRVDRLLDRDHNSFIYNIKNANARYANLATKVEGMTFHIPELEASMESHTDRQFAKSVAHADGTAQKTSQHMQKYFKVSCQPLARLHRAEVHVRSLSASNT